MSTLDRPDLADDAPAAPVAPATPAERLVVDLAALHHQRRLMPLRRHQYGQVTSLLAEATSAATSPDEAEAFSTVAVAFTQFARGGEQPRMGRFGTSLGRAMRQVGNRGAYGPRDPGAARAVDRLLAAGTYRDVHEAVVAAVSRLDADAYPPHWAGLADDLVAWQDPACRDTVRTRWVRDFYTTRPAATGGDNANA